MGRGTGAAVGDGDDNGGDIVKKFLPWLFVLICFTAPDGGPVWIVKEQVVAVDRYTSMGKPSDIIKSEIFLSSGNQFYVKETPDQVAEKLQ